MNWFKKKKQLDYGDFSRRQVVIGDGKDFIRLDGVGGRLFVEGKLISEDRNQVEKAMNLLTNIQKEISNKNKNIDHKKDYILCPKCKHKVRVKYNPVANQRYEAFCDICQSVLPVNPEIICRIING